MLNTLESIQNRMHNLRESIDEFKMERRIANNNIDNKLAVIEQKLKPLNDAANRLAKST